MVEEAGAPRTTLSRRAWWFLLVGLAVREAVAPWTGHPFDLESFLRTGSVVAHGGSPYLVAAPPVPGASFAYVEGTLPLSSYPPFWPEVTGGLFSAWSALPGANRFVLYWLLKQPGIAGDALVAYLLWRLAHRWQGTRAQAERLLIGWALFPYAIVLSAIWGQFDSLLAALLLAAFLAGRPAERAAVYGFGVVVKWLTAIFLPLELFRAGRRGAAAVSLGFGAPLAVGAIPFLLQGWDLPRFTSVAVFVGHGNNFGMNFVYLLTSGPWAASLSSVPYLFLLLGFLWIPAAIAAGWLAVRWFGHPGPATEVRAVLFVLLAVLLVRWGLYEQYFVYAFALLALDTTLFHAGRTRLSGLTLALASAQLLANNDLGFRFLAPISPAVQPMFEHVEASAPWGPVRMLVLGLLAVLMTATLVQWIWVVGRDIAAPTPWPRALASAIGRRIRTRGGSGGFAA